ncbi:uncharacterized protein BP01DRAFT_385075 [Aspergillus saccharolyticus JOP 1030-1]|uniref:Multicopper oxidase n=1 Tax=Aspergillus saccharolyticus JOP 1030-1 TaxID=1450539 RepID=A0A318Z6E9_9EURO|nr:hypothetical protein BP01DRAFT_385075 [Aspergillus saccharolyticus JOP 1030-1]PYH42871.1 hypothetical protein BP01DRAFT_385075 [Aspergillus saccharolyticus JOP 1030-1]
MVSWLPFFLRGASALSAACNTSDENSRYPYGTLPTNYLAPSIHDEGAPQSPPWRDVSPFGRPPDTGVTRHYDFTVMRDTTSPDGYQKNAMLINGQFPGPLIEANWGDIISVTVNNMITTGTEEGLAMHWHGITQKGTPWADGVPGVSQCPIVPRSRFTYTFQADQYGTGWYHSHYSAQLTDGVFGPMVIHGPTHVDYDYDLGAVMISEYHHLDYWSTLVEIFMRPPVIPNVDNNLTNGRGMYNCNGTNCSAGPSLSRFQFKSGKVHRLRLLNTGSNANQKISIDGHTLTVIATDYIPIKPYNTEVVTLGPGQRTDILVKATGNVRDAYWMRSSIDMECLNSTATYPTGTAAIYYEDADTTVWPTSTSTATWQSNNCAGEPLSLTVPYYALPPPHSPATTETMEINVGQNATGHFLWYFNNATFRANYNAPLLLLGRTGNFSSPYYANANTYNYGSNSSVRIIFNNIYPMQHPLHLHGHNFWVLAEGRGAWDGVITNPSNPLRRDTHIVQSGTTENPAYVVLEWELNHPGVWPLHCHMSFHVSAGLSLNIIVRFPSVERLSAVGGFQQRYRGIHANPLQEQPSEVEQLQIPASLAQTCREWAVFSGEEFVDEIDSGV